AVLVGGTEAPISSFGATCYYETGEMADLDPDNMEYHTLGKKTSGLVLGEGCAVLTLETEALLAARGGTALGELLAGEITTDPGGVGSARLVTAMQRALA